MVGGRLCTELRDVTADVSALDSEGFWVVLLPYEWSPTAGGGAVCARFDRVRPARRWTGPAWRGPAWRGPHRSGWSTSLDHDRFRAGVTQIRSHIAAGSVYQVNLTRRLSARLPAADPSGPVDASPSPDVAALGAALAEGNPAPFSAVGRIPELGVHVASASPELFLARAGTAVRSSPIKGTAKTAELLTPKDEAENVMIVDLVRNDLGRVCEYGSVRVPSLLQVEPHPGLVHLVSTVEGRLRPGLGWPELLAATFPAGSITGAPKLAACGVISELEPVPRSYYCGAIGWVDADRTVGELNVAIRTFWLDEGHIHFGTGGGITWDSQPDLEWEETQLKAHNLIGLASVTERPA